MKLWVDDVRPAPEGYLWVNSVNKAIRMIEDVEFLSRTDWWPSASAWTLEVIDMDHDAGEYALLGGDYIKLLDWLEETGRNYPIHIHSMNPVGVANMRHIIKRNGWREV